MCHRNATHCRSLDASNEYVLAATHSFDIKRGFVVDAHNPARRVNTSAGLWLAAITQPEVLSASGLFIFGSRVHFEMRPQGLCRVHEQVSCTE